MISYSVESDDGIMYASPLGAINSVDAAAVSEFDTTALTLTIGQAESEEVTVGSVNLVSKAAASLAWTFWTSVRVLGYPVSDKTVEVGVQRTFDVTKSVLGLSLVSAYVSVDNPNFDGLYLIS